MNTEAYDILTRARDRELTNLLDLAGENEGAPWCLFYGHQLRRLKSRHNRFAKMLRVPKREGQMIASRLPNCETRGLRRLAKYLRIAKWYRLKRFELIQKIWWEIEPWKDRGMY